MSLVCRAALRTPSKALDRDPAYFLCGAPDFLERYIDKPISHIALQQHA
jgi:hypothetical protein